MTRARTDCYTGNIVQAGLFEWLKAESQGSVWPEWRPAVLGCTGAACRCGARDDRGHESPAMIDCTDFLPLPAPCQGLDRGGGLAQLRDFWVTGILRMAVKEGSINACAGCGAGLRHNGDGGGHGHFFRARRDGRQVRPPFSGIAPVAFSRCDRTFSSQEEARENAGWCAPIFGSPCAANRREAVPL